MFRILLICGLLICGLLVSPFFTIPAMAQEDSYNTDLGLPHWAPGRGHVDHDALRRRAFQVLKLQLNGFQEATQGLLTASYTYCDEHASDAERTAARPVFEDAFRQTYLAWAALDSYQFGPIEQRGAALSVNFWPDKRNFVGRAVQGLLQMPAHDQRDPTVIAAGSVAAQGLPAIERLLYTDTGGRECPALIGISAHLRQTANVLSNDWFSTLPGAWGGIVLTAGPDNPVYQTKAEFTKELYTALDFGLIRIADQRLGRPLGTYERSFPTRAEAWRAGLSNDIIRAQLDGIAMMIRLGFAGDIREPDRAWALEVIEQAKGRLDQIDMPLHEAVQDPMARFRVEALQTKIQYLRTVMAQDIGPNLGVETGFSPADRD